MDFFIIFRWFIFLLLLFFGKADYFDFNKDYIYDFDSEFAATLQQNQQCSSGRMNFIIKVNFHPENLVTLKITEAKMGIFHDEFPATNKIHDFAIFDNVEIRKEDYDKLLLPVKFKYVNGEVGAILFHTNDSIFSENVKRSIINLFQYKLHDESEAIEDYVSLYRTNETTIEGDCESLYNVLKGPGEKYSIEKSIDSSKCSGHKNEFENVLVSTVTETNIDESFLKKAQVSASYYSLTNGINLNVIAHARISFLNTTKNSENETSSMPMKPPSSLVFDEEAFRFYPKMENVPKIVFHSFKRLETDSAGKFEYHITHEFKKLVTVIRHSTSEDISKIVKDVLFGEEIDQNFAKNILVDSLAAAGTRISLNCFFELVINGTIDEFQAAATMSNFVNVRFVSPEMINDFKEFLKNSKIQQSENLKKNAMLSFGIMVNKMCKNNNYCDDEFEKETINNIIKWNGDDSSKILLIKVLGNIGSKNVVSFLEKEILDAENQEIIRIEAIMALRQLPKEKAVHELLLFVFQNRSGTLALRINALNALLHSQIDQAIIYMIMGDLINEKEPEIKYLFGEFVSKMIKNSDEETASMYETLAISFNFSGLTHCDKKMSDLIPSMKSFQELLEISHEFSDGESLKRMITEIEALTDGFPKMYEFGFLTLGMEKVMKQISEQIDESRNSPLLSLFNWMKSLFSPSHKEEMPAIIFFKKYQNFDIDFYVLNKATIPSLVQQIHDVHQQLQYFPLKWISSQFIFEKEEKISTVIGIPLHASIQIPSMTHVKFISSTRSDSSITFEKEVKFASTMFSKLKIISPLFAIGVKTYHSVNSNVPIKSTISFGNNQTLFPKLEITIPKSNHTLVILQSRPITFTEIRQQNSSYIKEEQKTVIGNEQNYREKVENVSFFGSNFNLNYHGNVDIFGENFAQISLADSLSMEISLRNNALKFSGKNSSNGIDWYAKGFVTDAKDQKNCTSCWAFPCVGLAEAWYKKKYGQLFAFGEQRVLDCGRNKNLPGCFDDSGADLTDGFDVIKKYGVYLMEYDEWQDGDRECLIKEGRELYLKNARFNLYQFSGLKELKERLDLGPVAGGVYIDKEESPWFDFTGDEIFKVSCFGMDPTHALLITGYGTTPAGEDYFIIKNSWGKKFGKDGFAKLSADKKYNSCLKSFISLV